MAMETQSDLVEAGIMGNQFTIYNYVHNHSSDDELGLTRQNYNVWKWSTKESTWTTFQQRAEEANNPIRTPKASNLIHADGKCAVEALHEGRERWYTKGVVGVMSVNNADVPNMPCQKTSHKGY